jgi:hypothetical protein
MPFALISNGAVVQIANEKFPVHSSLTWVDAGSAAVGWAYANGTFTAPPDAPSALPALAKLALDASDRTVLRCFEAGVAVTEDWKTYRVALRAIVAGSSGATALPTRPAYPAGT